MKTIAFATLAGAFALVATHAAEVGKPAPAFTAKTTQGETVSLADFKDKIVVLEWVNHGCPFVRKHYESGNLPKLQKDATAKGVVWITVNSAAEGKPGHMEPSQFGKETAAKGNAATHVLMDSDGTVGKAFDAKVTPHMFIIGKDGTLRYDGAIDSKPTTEAADLASADPLFSTALDAVINGTEVPNSKNKPYGCGVKY